MNPTEKAQSQLISTCERMTEHVKMLRDYATTPDNVWLARSELNQITVLAGEMEELLSQIKQS